MTCDFKPYGEPPCGKPAEQASLDKAGEVLALACAQHADELDASSTPTGIVRWVPAGRVRTTSRGKMTDSKRIANTLMLRLKAYLAETLRLGVASTVGPDYEASLLGELEKYVEEFARLNVPRKPYTVVFLNDSYEARMCHVMAVSVRDAMANALMEEFEIPYEKAEEKLDCDSDFTIAAVFDGHIEEAKS